MPKKKAGSFVESLIVKSESCAIAHEHVHDDLKREAEFAKQALSAVAEARKKILKAGIPFARPPGYFCEMLKTKEQMNKISKDAEEKKASAKKAEDARRQRQLKKFGKKVQAERLVEKQKQKSAEIAKLNQLRKKRPASDDSDGFDVSVEDATRPSKSKKTRHDAAKVSGKRQHKNEKFGFGGKKQGRKRNTKDSTDDFEFSAAKNKRPFRGVAGFEKGLAKRPGKQRRQQMRNKAASKRRH